MPFLRGRPLSRAKGDALPEGKITVTVNPKKKTIVIEDNGIGMAEAEVEKYIARLAASGAGEFLKRMENGQGADIIGKFGLGFYSAFMVAQKVELESLSMEKRGHPLPVDL